MLLLGNMFRADKIAVADINQFGNFANKVIFVFIEFAIGIGDTPHVRDKLEFFGGAKRVVYGVGEFVERSCRFGILSSLL